jgi:hypothetical protein
MITMQRKAGANGYFANKRFGTRDLHRAFCFNKP